jgi:pyruvate/2-oxoglutarate dehydrogenase complex dihydrolipoamide acyltransferase (E2) component
VDGQIQVLCRHVLVGGEVPVGEVLARGEREGQAARPCPRRRRGPGPADRADLAADAESVEVDPLGPQAADFGVHRVSQFRRRPLDPGADDATEALVLGNLPEHGHDPRRHPAEPVGRQGVGRQAGPQHHPARQRVAGRDAQGEQAGREPAARQDRCVGEPHHGRRQPGAGRSGKAKEPAPIELLCSSLPRPSLPHQSAPSMKANVDQCVGFPPKMMVR